ncbi:S-methyl-5-thioribose-1-phosphate isomerase [Kosmotoga pacifica]|uniref:Methylthioribose-1-phosphate isomerase n=1 Tax=Kosmotoga pacifica TaxID=1330330 RepID=A0A0G2Z693_9BACT|nr:S-methyl-5-thioribose-1-phosphate isomerase [Kosmotoga pacifica]AKI97125.1 methylthioribose-1-phosphate isomerase [Kosmotoga pacifica]
MPKLKTMTLEWTGDSVVFVDQRKLPLEEVYVRCTTHEETFAAIKDMIVRGAPAIGASAAFGYVLGAKEFDGNLNSDEGIRYMESVKERLASSRPTAVNLFWALDRMHKKFLNRLSSENIIDILEEEALTIAHEDIEVNKAIGKYGAELLRDGDTVLTHCNAGALATVDYGTALGVIRAAVEAGKKISVYADETRPYLQGARLTAWELMKDGIDVTLISDNMAGWVMSQGKINAVVVGADRIAANGDVANKIGTYSVAVLAQRHGIPFYVAAPLSTIDLLTPTGKEIPIEERSHKEITHVQGMQVAPNNVKCYNPAFDVTPWNLITGIITEKGVVRPPYDVTLKKLFD